MLVQFVTAFSINMILPKLVLFSSSFECHISQVFFSYIKVTSKGIFIKLFLGVHIKDFYNCSRHDLNTDVHVVIT